MGKLSCSLSPRSENRDLSGNSIDGEVDLALDPACGGGQEIIQLEPLRLPMSGALEWAEAGWEKSKLSTLDTALTRLCKLELSGKSILGWDIWDSNSFNILEVIWFPVIVAAAISLIWNLPNQSCLHGQYRETWGLLALYSSKVIWENCCCKLPSDRRELQTDVAFMRCSCPENIHHAILAQDHQKLLKRSLKSLHRPRKILTSNPNLVITSLERCSSCISNDASILFASKHDTLLSFAAISLTSSSVWIKEIKSRKGDQWISRPRHIHKKILVVWRSYWRLTGKWKDARYAWHCCYGLHMYSLSWKTCRGRK